MGCQQEIFVSPSGLRVHITRKNLPGASLEQIQALTSLAKRPATENAPNWCPICKHPISDFEIYIKHVSSHLEQLALFALPDLDADIEAREPEENEKQDTSTTSSELSLENSQRLAGSGLAKNASTSTTRLLSVEDIQSMNPTDYKIETLAPMINTHISDIFVYTFALRDDKAKGGLVDLVDNGRNIPVTAENKTEWIRALAEYMREKQEAEKCIDFWGPGRFV